MLGYNIILIGFMGCGKTTVSNSLRDRYGMDVVDMDSYITQHEGMSIPEIFERYGEEHFRQLETALLGKLQGESDIVISCGGGAALREENVALMRRCGKVIWLRASAATIYARVRNNRNRPLLDGHMNIDDISEMMEGRRNKYEEASDIVIDVDNISPADVADEIIRLIAIREEK